jgi:hypothetical protein
MITINEEFKKILSLNTISWDHLYFQNVTSYVKNEGLWLEFGVCSGRTINLISKCTNTKVYGFDSFYGYTEEFGPFKKGAYNYNGIPPNFEVPNNVKLIVGFSFIVYLSTLILSSLDKIIDGIDLIVSKIFIFYI